MCIPKKWTPVFCDRVDKPCVSNDIWYFSSNFRVLQSQKIVYGALRKYYQDIQGSVGPGDWQQTIDSRPTEQMNNYYCRNFPQVPSETDQKIRPNTKKTRKRTANEFSLFQVYLKNKAKHKYAILFITQYLPHKCFHWFLRTHCFILRDTLFGLSTRSISAL